MNMLWLLDSFSMVQTPLASLEEVLGISIPLAGIIMPFLFVLGVLAIVFAKNYKTRKLKHETIRIMIEKGQPIPPDLLTGDEEHSTRKRDDRKSGLVSLAIGIGAYFFLANYHDIPEGVAWIALIPGLIGVALLLNWWLARMEKKNDSADAK